VIETWPVRKENEVALQWAEMRMVRWMCMEYEVESARPKGRSKETWTEIMQKDRQARKLNREDTMDSLDCTRWMKQITDD